MEIVSDESVSAVAEELGVDVEAVGASIASQVELKLRYLVQDAAKFMRHSRRQRMSTHDIDHALRLRGHPRIFGFAHSDPDKFRFLQKQNVFFLDEQDVCFNTIIGNEEKLFLSKRVPLKPEFGIHWLAVDGIQPNTRENPSSLSLTKPPQQNDTLSSSTKSKTGSNIMMHSLSKELQTYFDKIVYAVNDAALGNVAAQRSVYHSLSQDPGLQQLMRYISKFVSETVAKSTNDLSLLTATMSLVRCVLVNPNLEKELYLHQLMPAILTCIVHKELCRNPLQDHWELRRFSASLLPIIVYSDYGSKYENVKARVTKTLSDTLLKGDLPMSTQYGAICGIIALGPLTCQAVLLPLMTKMIAKYNKVISGTRNEMKRLEAQHCLGAMQMACGVYIAASKSKGLSAAIVLDHNYKQARSMVSATGEASIPWICAADPSEYVQLLV